MPFSLIKFAESHGIKIEYWDFVPPLEAVYMSSPGIPPVIGLSRSLFDSRAYFRCVLAEEIGHHFTTVGSALPETHFHYSNRLDVSRAEYRALRWAAEYLIPLERLEECLHNNISEIWNLAEYFDVTEQMMRFRLNLPDLVDQF